MTLRTLTARRVRRTALAATVGVTPVAAQDYSDYGDGISAEQKEFLEPVDSVGKFFELDIEAVAKAEPDVIVGEVPEIDPEIGMKPAASLPTGGFPKGWEEYSTERIGESLGDADAVTVTAKPDGTVDPVMRSVLGNALFRNLKATKDDHVFPDFGEVTDYGSATASPSGRASGCRREHRTRARRGRRRCSAPCSSTRTPGHGRCAPHRPLW
ncbi:hypothetical protein [uncultured Corynebacterium sp.]|uniref:hypothetical protein n=1 Tax=uncultured Corynebacterium sp. TaxID=159447 RepID=UPI0025F82C3C|nr:hypothetical protein [uncultured Corynebacterium sp.]